MVGLETLKKNRMYTGVATDFDGTISAIRLKQTAATIEPEAKDLLVRLKQEYRLVSIISGRPVKQLAQLVSLGGLVYVGNHGAEFLTGKHYQVEEEAKKIAPLLREIYGQLKTYQKEFDLDFKKYSLSIHYRRHQQPEMAEKRLESLLGKYLGGGLKIQKGRKVVNLSAKNIDKGSAIEHLTDKYGLRYFLYVGDDLTDVDAFDKMTELENKGLATLKIALDSKEAPEGLVQKSDLQISSLKKLFDLLKALLH